MNENLHYFKRRVIFHIPVVYFQGPHRRKTLVKFQMLRHDSAFFPKSHFPARRILSKNLHFSRQKLHFFSLKLFPSINQTFSKVWLARKDIRTWKKVKFWAKIGINRSWPSAIWVYMAITPLGGRGGGGGESFKTVCTAEKDFWNCIYYFQTQNLFFFKNDKLEKINLWTFFDL